MSEKEEIIYKLFLTHLKKWLFVLIDILPVRLIFRTKSRARSRQSDFSPRAESSLDCHRRLEG